MGEWREVDLDEVASELTVGHVGPMVSEYRDEGVPFIRSTDIEPFRIKRDQLKYINPEFHSRLKKSALKPGDVVIVRTGKPGTCAMIPVDLPDANCSDVVIVRTGPELDPRYLAYYINSAARAHIDAFSGGAVQQHFNVGAARRIRMNLPPIGEQERIVQVLGNLDAKIDLLHRQNKTLEAMTETLFRQWFVERRPEVLEGEAEEGWEEGTLDQILSVRGGTTPSTKNPEFWDGDIHWTTPRDLSSASDIFLFDTARKITAKGLAEIGSGLSPSGTLLMSSRAPVGYLAFADMPIAVNQGYIVIIDDKGVGKHFIYLWLKANMDLVHSYANGSTFQEISKSAFKTMELTIPPTTRVADFEDTVKPLFMKIRANLVQVQKLTALRDTLLPKLMSGEVRVGQMKKT